MAKLVPFFRIFCRRYCESNNPAFAMAAEALIDGMDLDASWCRMSLGATLLEELKFALKLVEGKGCHIFDPSLGEVTCHVASTEEAQRIRKIPGTEESVFARISSRTASSTAALTVTKYGYPPQSSRILSSPYLSS